MTPDEFYRKMSVMNQRRIKNNSVGAVLHIRVDGGAAVELQHKTPIVLERINAFYGYRAVDRLKLVQGPLPEPEATRGKSMRELSLAESTFIEREAASTKNSDLRDALLRLGVSMFRRQDKSLKSDDFGN